MKVKDMVLKLVEAQPAHLMYAYDGGWQVMQEVRTTVFSKTHAFARRYWYKWMKAWSRRARSANHILLKYWFWTAVIGLWIAGTSQYLSAILIIVLFIFFQLGLLLAWMMLTSLMILFLSFVNVLHGYYYRIFFRCPDCYEQMTIPIIVCPKCATEHTRLWPSVYGVFRHRCSKCNTRLPTLDILGRNKLVQKCVACERPMNKKIGRLINVHIPVVGGPSAGKSNYIFMAMNRFIEEYAGPRNYQVEFPDEKHEQLYRKNLRNLSTGTVLLKTPEVRPEAYNLALKRPYQRIGRIVYIYDAAGEAYLNEDHVILQTYYKYVHGLIFIIDPFSIEAYRQKHEAEINRLKASIRPSTLGVMAAYERMLTVLETSVGLKRGKKFEHPLAIVISKTDGLDLDQQIGHKAARRLMARDSSICLEEDAISILVEQFLTRHRLDNFVRDVYLQFEEVKFFSCSALGRNPDTNNQRPFEPDRVLDPLLWLLGQVNVVKTRQERLRRIDADHRRMAWAQDNLLKAARFYYWDSLKPREE
jgi:hypothetical protein